MWTSKNKQTNKLVRFLKTDVTSRIKEATSHFTLNLSDHFWNLILGLGAHRIWLIMHICPTTSYRAVSDQSIERRGNMSHGGRLSYLGLLSLEKTGRGWDRATHYRGEDRMAPEDWTAKRKNREIISLLFQVKLYPLSIALWSPLPLSQPTYRECTSSSSGT